VTLRKVEVFTAGCSLCDDAVQLVQSLACSSCDVEILDMKDESAQQKARQYGVTRVPAVTVNGTLADCCASGSINSETLRALGVGSPA
jgi:glutaredoxin